MASLTRQLSRLIDSKPVDDHDLGVARLFLLDAAANMIAGQNSEAGQKLLKWARDIAPDGDLTRLDAGRKAFLLGGLCHILEMDDLHRASVVHPGCAVAPVIFALAAGGDGIEGLTAFIKGIEATTRVGMAVGPEHYQIWHNTATCGPFGSVIAAAICSTLMRTSRLTGWAMPAASRPGFGNSLTAELKPSTCTPGERLNPVWWRRNLRHRGLPVPRKYSKVHVVSLKPPASTRQLKTC